MFKNKLSPWVTGVIIVFLSALSLYLIDAPLGSINSYYQLLNKTVEAVNGKVPEIDWNVFFIIFVFVGAFVASIVGKEFKLQLFPEDHMSKGPSFYLTLGPVYSFIGGLLVMSGLIIAGDSFIDIWRNCMNLNIITLLFLIIMFVEAVMLGTIMTIRIEEKNDKK